MRKRFIHILSKGYLPRWVVFIFDIGVAFTAFIFSYILRYNFMPLDIDTSHIAWQLLIVIVSYGFWSSVLGSYAGVIRNTTSHDIVKIFMLVVASTGVLTAITFLGRWIWPGSAAVIPLSVIIIHTALTAFALTISRMLIKYFYYLMKDWKLESTKVMIYGAGELGLSTFLSIDRASDVAYNVVGFIDIDSKLQGMTKSGVKIYSPDDAMEKVIPGQEVKEIIIAIHPDNIKKKRVEEIYEYCLEHGVEIKKVPPLNEWINGTFSANQIRRIAIEDLLGREVIKLNNSKIQSGLRGRTVMVTGAAGSIGSEIVRQLMIFETGRVILLDKAESPLYDLQMELKAKYGNTRNFEPVIADITNEVRMRRVFETFRPNIVFNAAAYKHVPLMEDNPYEAVRVNIGGTKILADLSVFYGVDKFVMISTDKAVNPTNVMGTSKRICEQYIQALDLTAKVKTQFITTRFGNVLGSNGSVVPLFLKQIKAGGPVTVTHRDIRRFFMTIPEACQLVLEAGFMGNGGEIYLFDMGEPVRIWDMAEKMISLAGLVPHRDIKIIETGLRPGEKLYEEVLANQEETIPTYNPKIMIGNVRPVDYSFVNKMVCDMLDNIDLENDLQIVARMSELVPEFVPQNPRYRGATFIKN